MGTVPDPGDHEEPQDIAAEYNLTFKKFLRYFKLSDLLVLGKRAGAVRMATSRGLATLRDDVLASTSTPTTPFSSPRAPTQPSACTT